MKNFILDEKPRFDSTNVTLGGTRYELTKVNNNGCHLSVFEHGLERDQLTLTKTDMRALFMLLCTEK